MTKEKNPTELTDQDLDQAQGGAGAQLDNQSSTTKTGGKISASLVSPMESIAKDPTKKT